MRKLFTLLITVLLTAIVFAQSPEKMSYQAVIRDDGGNLVTEQEIGMQITILQGSENGTIVYRETHLPTTNVNGLVSIEIGTGTVLGTTFGGSFVPFYVFSDINWANGPYFIKSETDPSGGTSYTITGTSQLLSVPYALHAKTADSITGANVPTGTQTGEMQYWNGTTWITVAPGTTGQVLTFVSGVPTWKATEGKTDVTNPTTGKIWMDRNLGASQVATSSTDGASYGDLYQWGRAADGHEKRTSGTTVMNATTAVPNSGNSWDGLFITEESPPYDWLTPQDANLWQGVSGTNNPCPSGYRLPTEAEWEAELTSWGSNNNSVGAFGSPLKLPMAGNHYYDSGSLSNVGSYGYYWSSTVVGSKSRNLYFDSSYADMASFIRAYGFSVRCLKE